MGGRGIDGWRGWGEGGKDGDKERERGKAVGSKGGIQE